MLTQIFRSSRQAQLKAIAAGLRESRPAEVARAVTALRGSLATFSAAGLEAVLQQMVENPSVELEAQMLEELARLDKAIDALLEG
jgi:hypothetical protein